VNISVKKALPVALLDQVKAGDLADCFRKDALKWQDEGKLASPFRCHFYVSHREGIHRVTRCWELCQDPDPVESDLGRPWSTISTVGYFKKGGILAAAQVHNERNAVKFMRARVGLRAPDMIGSCLRRKLLKLLNCFTS